MLLALVQPTIHNGLETAKIDAVNAVVGDALTPKVRLLEYTVGLDDALAHDCPPITSFRLTLAEKAWLRQLNVAAGATVRPGDVLAILSTSPEEPIDGQPERMARTSSAAILQSIAW